MGTEVTDYVEGLERELKALAVSVGNLRIENSDLKNKIKSLETAKAATVETGETELTVKPKSSGRKKIEVANTQ